MRSLIAVISLLLGFALLFCILFAPISPDRKEASVQIQTFAIGLIMLVVGYYFTTSQGSSEKNEMLNK